MARTAAFALVAPLPSRAARARRAATSMATTSPPAPGATRLALCQIPVTPSKVANLATARAYLARAAAAGAHVAVLPESWNCPYDTALFAKYAEPVPGAGAPPTAAGTADSVAMLRDTAADLGIHIIGGSIPEATPGGDVFNTSLTVAPDGAVLAKHRKVHLFDVDCSAAGGVVFTESDTLSAGASLTSFTTVAPAPPLTVGVGVCYDIRFPDLSLALARRHAASLLVFPGAFNMTTGPAHWELLARARAVDTQCYVAVCSPARVAGAPGYTPWGHSCVVDPWGEVLAMAGAGEGIVWADVSPERIDQVRAMIPTGSQRRPDVYES
jgi:omega-amidase